MEICDFLKGKGKSVGGRDQGKGHQVSMGRSRDHRSSQMPGAVR